MSSISEADRDLGVERLREAYARGHISHEEMDERLDQVLAARTRDELVSALVALPEESGVTSAIGAVGGVIRRRGGWRVPRFLKVESAFGRVRLDLSRALIEYPVVDIELRLGTGRARITVPRDAVVDMEGLSTAWKPPHYRAARRPRDGGPTIRISGNTGMGRLRISHARR
nr:DUF1707 domain-containing protein [Streptomyces sp. SID5468]